VRKCGFENEILQPLFAVFYFVCVLRAFHIFHILLWGPTACKQSLYQQYWATMAREEKNILIGDEIHLLFINMYCYVRCHCSSNAHVVQLESLCAQNFLAADPKKIFLTQRFEPRAWIAVKWREKRNMSASFKKVKNYCGTTITGAVGLVGSTLASHARDRACTQRCKCIGLQDNCHGNSLTTHK